MNISIHPSQCESSIIQSTQSAFSTWPNNVHNSLHKPIPQTYPHLQNSLTHEQEIIRSSPIHMGGRNNPFQTRETLTPIHMRETLQSSYTKHSYPLNSPCPMRQSPLVQLTCSANSMDIQTPKMSQMMDTQTTPTFTQPPPSYTSIQPLSCSRSNRATLPLQGNNVGQQFSNINDMSQTIINSNNQHQLVSQMILQNRFSIEGEGNQMSKFNNNNNNTNRSSNIINDYNDDDNNNNIKNNNNDNNNNSSNNNSNNTNSNNNNSHTNISNDIDRLQCYKSATEQGKNDSLESKFILSPPKFASTSTQSTTISTTVNNNNSINNNNNNNKNSNNKNTTTNNNNNNINNDDNNNNNKHHHHNHISNCNSNSNSNSDNNINETTSTHVKHLSASSVDKFIYSPESLVEFDSPEHSTLSIISTSHIYNDKCPSSVTSCTNVFAQAIPSKISNKVERKNTMDKKQRREIANSNERKRMENINSGFRSLKTLLPQNQGEKASKASILQQTAQHLGRLSQENRRITDENTTLKNELSKWMISSNNFNNVNIVKQSPYTQPQVNGYQHYPLINGAPIPMACNKDLNDVVRLQDDVKKLKEQLEKERLSKYYLEQRNRHLETRIDFMDMNGLYPQENRDTTLPNSESQRNHNIDSIVMSIRSMEDETYGNDNRNKTPAASTYDIVTPYVEIMDRSTTPFLDRKTPVNHFRTIQSPMQPM